MKILITSGGTKVKIDQVRSITNMSRGTFGSRLAEEAEFGISELDELYQEVRGNDVIFFHAENSKLPFGNGEGLVRLVSFDTFDDYCLKLENLIKTEKPEVVILAAAVSDYGVANYVDGKIRSNSNMIIELKPLPKIISKIKEWEPNTYLVGFKLLVDSTEEELISAAKLSIEKNKCDLVVANDLIDIKNNNHKLTLVYSNEKIEYCSKYENGIEQNLAKFLHEKIIQDYPYRRLSKEHK